MTAAATTAPAACNLLRFISISFFKATTPLARYNITPRGADGNASSELTEKSEEVQMKGIESPLAMPVAALVLFLAPGCASTPSASNPGLRAELAPTGTLLVAPGSTIGSVAEADKAGVNIAAARGAATTLYLQRELKQAQVLQAENEPAAFNLIKEGKAQVYAQNRYMLLCLADNLPGARVLEDRFSAAEMSIALPKGRPAALAYVSEFVEQSKKSGTVQRAIETAKLRGVRVAP